MNLDYWSQERELVSLRDCPQTQPREPHGDCSAKHLAP